MAEDPNNKENSKARDWSVEETEMLIEEFKRFPCLYNTSSKDWKNTSLKNRAKISIAAKFDQCNSSDVDYKLGRLKTRFVRERLALESSLPSGSSKQKERTQWEFYNDLIFLDKHVKRRRRTSNIPSKECLNEEHDQPHGLVEMDANDIPMAGPETNIGHIVYTEDALDADEASDLFNENASFVTDMAPDICLGREESSTPNEDTRISGREESSTPNEDTRISGREESSTPNEDTRSSTTESSEGTSRKRKRKANSGDDTEKEITEVLNTIVSVLNQPQKPPASIVDPVLSDWEAYCTNFARRVASIESEYKRDRIRQIMEETYMSYKHGDM